MKSTLAAVFAIPLVAGAAWADIEVHEQYARSSNPAAGAAFMVIHNHGETDDYLIGVTSDAAARVELHTHAEDENGVMRMVHVEDGLALPAGGEIVMERGHEHIMFMGLEAPFEDGQTVTVMLEFQEAGVVEVEIPVDLSR